MTATMAPEVLADPLGVVGLVADVEPGLDRAVITDVVAHVAAGRAKRRRLAQALLDRPAVLADGRSPAPRVVGDLLIALRKAGADSVSPPVCARCGKRLRTLQRRGEDWYCGVCGPQPEPCAGCGQARPVSCRDQDGRPRCVQCGPADERDPVAVVVDVVAGVDSTLPVDAVVAAVRAAAPRIGQCRQLAWAVQDRPDLLTGAGAQAPVPAVLRLIDQLCDAGAQKITRPACPRCHRGIGLHRRIDGQWLCRNCVAKSRAQPCSQCGTVRPAAARDEHGRPLCPYCLIIDPANQETCIGCSRRRPVSVRTPNGPLCPACRPIETMTCSICGRQAPCFVSKTTGEPWCGACKQRWARCTGCGEVKPVRGGTTDKPCCATCTRPDPELWRDCPGCGQPGRIHNGRCARCTIQQRLRDLLGDEHGQIRAGLETLYRALATTDRPNTVAAWLHRSGAPTILRELAGRELTHQVLDELRGGKPVEHLRSVLVAVGALPVRDEQMARLERWITHTLAARTDPDEQHLLHRYAVWHLLRRLRQRTDGGETTYTQLEVVRQHVRGATTLLDWLTAHDLTLAACRQPDLESWLTSNDATHRREAGHFVRWAKKQKLTRLDFPQPSGTAPPAACTPRPVGNRPAGCCTMTRSSPRTASLGCSCCSTPSGRPRSADSPSTTSTPATTKYGYNSTANPSCSRTTG